MNDDAKKASHPDLGSPEESLREQLLALKMREIPSAKSLNEAAAALEAKQEQAKHLEMLEARIRVLEAENAGLRRGVSLMHRRCQENEGAAHRLERVRAGYEKEKAILVGDARFWSARASLQASKCRNLERQNAELRGRSFFERLLNLFA